MNFDQHLREMAQHLVTLDKTPGWQAYVKERLKELRRSHPMYEALPPLIRELLATAPSNPGTPNSQP